jgi:hypothetical protein
MENGDNFLRISTGIVTEANFEIEFAVSTESILVPFTRQRPFLFCHACKALPD